MMLAPGLARAQPPNLNLLSVAPGQGEAEFTSYTAMSRHGSPALQFNSELNYGLSERMALQFQITGFGADTGLHSDGISAQALFQARRWSDRAGFGISVEAGYDPSQSSTEVGALLYATAPLGPLDAAGNLGVESQPDGSHASMVYAWSVGTDLSKRWGLALQGGGSSPLGDAEPAEHYMGPLLTYALPGPRPAEINAGYLAGLNRRTPGLLQIGVSVGF